MLQDIGIPHEVLRDLGKTRLKFAEITAGGEECVLHNLWKCAADGVFDGSGDLDERWRR